MIVVAIAVVAVVAVGIIALPGGPALGDLGNVIRIGGR